MRPATTRHCPPRELLPEEWAQVAGGNVPTAPSIVLRLPGTLVLRPEPDPWRPLALQTVTVVNVPPPQKLPGQP